MRERGLLFVGPMVRAIGRNAKTMTRRAVNCLLGFGAITEFGKSDTAGYHWCFRDKRQLWNEVRTDWLLERCPYGMVGDRLWVRETCRAHELTDDEARQDKYGLADQFHGDHPPCGLDGVVYQADDVFRPIENTIPASEDWVALNCYRGKRGAWVNSIHMPRWASRYTLEIVDVRLEQLHDITNGDALAEGVPATWGDWYGQAPKWAVDSITRDDGAGGSHNWDNRTSAENFGLLWRSINGDESWQKNEWVWALRFKRLAENRPAPSS